MGPNNDLLDWLVVKRSLAMEDKWAMQLHSHPDFEEYWFVTEGKGKIICGDETYEVEPGDLVITPRGVPHKAIGDVTFICCTAKHNSIAVASYKETYFFAPCAARILTCLDSDRLVDGTNPKSLCCVRNWSINVMLGHPTMLAIAANFVVVPQ